MISLLLPILLLSVVVVGGAHAHPSTIRQRTLQDKDEACPTSFEYGSPCDITTQKGKECGYDFVYVGCGATEEEFECLPEMTCTCDDLSDGTWACPIERRAAMTEELAMANTCPENGITVSVKRGDTCTPSPSASASSSSSSVTDGNDETIENGNDNTFQQQGSDSAGSGNSDMNGGIDLLDPMNATAVDGTTLSASKDTVDNDNGIDSVDVTTPAVVDDNDSSTTTITVKGESEGAMSSLSSSSSQQGRVAVKVAMVAAVTATAAGITLFL